MGTFSLHKKDCDTAMSNSIGGLVVEYIVAIDVTRVRFPADASLVCVGEAGIQKTSPVQALRDTGDTLW